MRTARSLGLPTRAAVASSVASSVAIVAVFLSSCQDPASAWVVPRAPLRPPHSHHPHRAPPTTPQTSHHRRHLPSLLIRSAMAPFEEDQLIEDLSALSPFELPNRIFSEKRVLQTVGRPAFFLRIAELCDAASDEARKERLKALADNLSATLTAVAERAASRMDDASQLLSDTIAAAAEDDGEFLVPLSPEKLDALRAAINKRVDDGSFDETVLGTVSAAAKKAETDGLDGMVALMRLVFQLYAARALRFDANAAAAFLAQMTGADKEAATEQGLLPEYDEAARSYNRLLAASADDWDALIVEDLLRQNPQPVRKRELLAIVQAQIERVVLMQTNGSYAQRVQAEFLRELVARVEKISPGDDDDDEPPDLVAAFLNAAE